MPVGRYKTSFSILPEDAAEAPGRSERALVQTFQAMFAGSGGADVDRRIQDWGEASVVDQEVRWEPPSGLDPAVATYLKSSVDALNRYLRDGLLALDVNENIKPRGGQ